MDECYVLDTNVLLDYLFEYIDKNRHSQAQELVKVLKATSRIYIPNSVKREVVQIIAGSFAILRDLILQEIRTKDWDNLSAEDRLNLLDQIRENFDSLFEETQNKLYPNTTKGIRLLFAKRLYSKLHGEFVDKKLSEIQDVILTENKIKDLDEYYLTHKLSYEFSSFPKSVLIDISHEEVMKYTVFARAFGNVRNFGLNDLTIFYEIFSVVKGGVCRSTILISNDGDLIKISKDIVNNLENFIKSSNNEDHKRSAKEVLDTIRSYIIVVKPNEILDRLASSQR